MPSVQMVDSPRYTGPVHLPDEGLKLSGVSRRIQDVGGQLLASGLLVETGEEGIFTTSRIPVQDLGNRLLKARDDRDPLVEVVTLPTEDTDELIKALFGSDSRLIHTIRRSGGVERREGGLGVRLVFEEVGLIVPYIDTAESGESPCAPVVKASYKEHELGNYGKHKRRPGHGRSLGSYTTSEGRRWNASGAAADTNELLRQVLADYDI